MKSLEKSEPSEKGIWRWQSCAIVNVAQAFIAGRGRKVQSCRWSCGLFVPATFGQGRRPVTVQSPIDDSRESMRIQAVRASRHEVGHKVGPENFVLARVQTLRWQSTPIAD